MVIKFKIILNIIKRSCLFDSLSYFINYTSDEIRQKVCDYLETNQPIMEGLDTKFIIDLDGPNYVENMRRNSQWGGAIEIQSACNLFDIRILVHTFIGDRRIIEFIPINKKYTYTINISWNGVHFEHIANIA